MKKTFNDTIKMYKENEELNSFFINDNIIMTKLTALESIYDDKKNYEKNILTINTMKHNSFDSFEMTQIRKLLKKYKKWYLEETYGDITKYEMKINYFLKRKITFMKDQKMSFDSFKNNQNIFDNLISIIKIYQRYNMNYNENEIINGKINFEKIKNDEDGEYKKLFENLQSKIYNEFNIIRFIA